MKLETIVYIIRCRYENQLNASKSDVLTALVRMYGFTYELAKAALEDMDRETIEEEIKEYRMDFRTGSRVQIVDRIVDETSAGFMKACEIVGIDSENYLEEKTEEIGDLFHAYSLVNGREGSLIQTAEKFHVSMTNFVQLMCRFFFQLGEKAVCFRYRVLQERLSESGEGSRNLCGKSAQELDCILEDEI